MVFFLALALGARKKWITVKELVATGAVLTVSSAFIIYPYCARSMVQIYGYSQKALIWAAVPTLIFTIALGAAIAIMVRRLRDAPENANPSHKKARGKPAAKAAPTEPAGPPPKPLRKRGGKRRF